jgi:hypothetical protein
MSVMSRLILSGVTSRWWVWMSMNGNLARVGLCSGTRRVDLGLNSSIEMDWATGQRGERGGEGERKVVAHKK